MQAIAAVREKGDFRRQVDELQSEDSVSSPPAPEPVPDVGPRNDSVGDRISAVKEQILAELDRYCENRTWADALDRLFAAYFQEARVGNGDMAFRQLLLESSKIVHVKKQVGVDRGPETYGEISVLLRPRLSWSQLSW